MLTFEQHKAIAELYKLLKDRKYYLTKARGILEKKYSKNILNQLINKNLVEKSYYRINLTEEGQKVGFKSLRTLSVFRLFCQEILAISQKEADEYIEKIFFSIDDYILEKYCTLIGHAFRDTLPGECCRRAQMEISEQVIPLSKLPVNTPATILYIKTNVKATMLKLFELGLYPGKIIRIHQLYPAYIVFIEQQEIAIESSLADFIFVKK